MSILSKFINSAANRLNLGPRDQRDLIETVLRQLPRATYWRLREKKFIPGCIIDVGAHGGVWTREIREIFPTSRVLMIEARPEQEAILRQVCQELRSVDYRIALLGRGASGSVPFQVSGTGSSLFPERSDAPSVLRMLPMETLDDILVSYTQIADPLFIKLDIQGGELECLLGGKNALMRAEVVQLEVALLNYNEGAPLACETIQFMDAAGFAIFDIAGFLRPDGANLVQLDVIFTKKTSALRPNFFKFGPR